jgi:hypothetical protein
MPWLAVLVVANTFTAIEVGPKSKMNDIETITKDRAFI